MTEAAIPAPENRLWPRSTTTILLVLGIALSTVTLFLVADMGALSWHPARDAELRATYESYRETGTPLIKPTGSGSYGVQAPADGPLTFAAWDDDPGAYLIAEALSHVTGSDSPYVGLTLVQGGLIALPLLWLPLAVARLFKRASAGYAMVLLPPVMWLINGTFLVGTEYGLSDSVSSLPVYSLYGIAASLAFLSLSLLLLLATFPLRKRGLIAIVLIFGLLAGVGNLTRSLSGMGVAIAVGVLWWLHSSGSKRWLWSLGAGLVTVAIALGVPTGIMGVVNSARVQATNQSIEELPDAHTTWHSMYLGLSYPEPLTGEKPRFAVTWSDEFAWEKAREVDADVVIQGEQYDAILQELFFEEVASDPMGVLGLYIEKFFYLLIQFGWMLAFIASGFLVQLLGRPRHTRELMIGLAVCLPTLVIGMMPPVLVMPMLYYYSELSAALGLMTAISLGALAIVLSTIPSRLRVTALGRIRRTIATSRVQ